MAYWILPAFLITLGAGPAQLGVIEGIAESVASGAKLLSGYLADRFTRRKPLVIAGYAIANIAKPLLALTTAWWQVLFVRFADRTAKGIRGAPRDVMLSESVDKSRLGSAFGLMQAMDSAGSIVGPLIALALVSQLHFTPRNVFWVAAIPGVLSVVVVALFARETKHAPAAVVTADNPGADLQGDPRRPLPRSFYYVLFTVTLFSLGASSDMFLILRAQEMGIGVEYAPLLGLVFNIVYTLASWPAGKLSDRVPKRFVAAAGYLVYAATYLVFAQAPSHTALWVTMAFYGLFYALTNPVLRALVVETVQPDARGRALGLFYFTTSIGMLLASVGTGALWSRFGGGLPFYLSAGIAGASALLLLGAPRASDRP
jgi:MFS family permease